MWSDNNVLKSALAAACGVMYLLIIRCRGLHQGPARNRLLVKGGSSFNALVRAMKQDLVESGTAAKDPALIYEIDKVRWCNFDLAAV
jgi:hypothetical protein